MKLDAFYADVERYAKARGVRRWVLWLGIGSAAAIAAMFLRWHVRKRKQVIESILRDRRALSEDLELLHFKAMKSTNQAERQAILEDIATIQKASNAKQEEYVQNSYALQEELKQIEALTTWRQLDSRNTEKR